MNNLKIGLATGFGRDDVPFEERVALIAKVGFDAVFTGWSPDGSSERLADIIKENGLIYQSVHAPFNHIDKMWSCGEEGDAELEKQKACLDYCRRHNVDIMVSHVWIGFGEEHPNDIGIDRFAKMLDFAKECGVKVAFENTEGEKYLEYLRDNLFSHPNAGFCIDTGHEMCYNRSNDMITKYGANGKLIATHFNDNMAITGDHITWKDDSHLLPFDGVADWNGITDRLKAVGYNGILTSELTTKNKPDRTVNSIYDNMSTEEYLTEAYKRAVRIAELMER